MSDAFEPGSGWREVQRAEWDAAPAPTIVLHGPPTRYWVREESVPPLPTEPHTVIRVTWPEGESRAYSVLMLDEKGSWGGWLPDHLQQVIAGFEVLASPTFSLGGMKEAARVRRETANAVLDRVRKVHHSAGDMSIPARFRVELDHIAREFGVES